MKIERTAAAVTLNSFDPHFCLYPVYIYGMQVMSSIWISIRSMWHKVLDPPTLVLVTFFKVLFVPSYSRGKLIFHIVDTSALCKHR